MDLDRILLPKTLKGERVFICCDDPFPYGTANSNYVRNLALLFNHIGYEVYVIGLKTANHLKGSEYNKGTFLNIKYINISFEVSRLPFRLRNHYCYGNYINNCLEAYQVSEEDYIVLYTDYISVTKMVLEHYENLNRKSHIIYSIVEWYQPFQYTATVLNLDYQLWKYQFENVFPQFKKIISISRRLESYFKNKGCLTYVLPCLVDTKKFEPHDYKSRMDQNYYNFIYPGAATNKDSFEGMIGGLLLLNEDERKKIKLHLTTMTLNTLKKITKYSMKDLKVVAENIIFHGSLKYDELIDLYKHMDYLYLAREDNIVTQSNFPSKVPELLCFGIVPVCSDVGDYTSLYLIDDYNSIVYRGASPIACAEGLRRAITLTDNKLYSLKYNARKTSEREFDYRIWGNKVKGFLNDAR